MYLAVNCISYWVLLALCIGSPFLLGVILGLVDRGSLTFRLVSFLCSGFWLVVFGPFAYPEMYRLSVEYDEKLAAFLVLGGVLFGTVLSASMGVTGSRLGRMIRRTIKRSKGKARGKQGTGV